MDASPSADAVLRRLVPLDRFGAALLMKAQPIRIAIFDVDGVLTDGRITIGADGEVEKVFSALDGHGLKLLSRVGIEVVVITGRDSKAVRRRVTDLGIRHARYGVVDKLAAAEALRAEIAAAAGDAAPLPWAAIAAMGDDWPDLPLLLRAGFACAPPGAHPDVRQVVDHVTAAAAGFGAARECCDLLITATGRYADLLLGEARTLDGGSS
jgi:3-deoxy-D-manno-octulosonate 8-phosphate phosphatase (KDO 8-P phosphatase)